MTTRSLQSYFSDQMWKENQILVAILGICSALGITVKMAPAVTMALSVSFVTAFSSMSVSLLRNYTPDSVRMITQLALISMFVIIVNEMLKAYMFGLAKILSVYVGLIITNCIVMGRAEAMAKSVTPIPAFLDGLGAGLGYGSVICIVAFIREIAGYGTVFGYRVIPTSIYATADNPDAYANMGIFLSPPGAFFILGAFIWVANIIKKKG